MRLSRLFLPPFSLLLLLPAAPAVAQNPIHRCIGADGNPVFTDQPCMALQATSVQAPAHPTAPVGTPAPEEPPPLLCAANAAELRQSVIDAFASRDPNRLAGLMLWNGYDRNTVVADISALNALMQYPLLDVGPAHTDDNDPAQASSAGGEASRSDASESWVLRTAANEASGNLHERHYSVVHRYGCLWLRDTN